MVFVTSDQFQKAYQWIKEDSLGGGCTVLIFVSRQTPESLPHFWPIRVRQSSSP